MAIYYDKKELEPCQECARLQAEIVRLQAALRESQRSAMPLHKRMMLQ